MPLLLATFTGTVANNVVNVPMPLLLADLGVPLSAGSLVVTGFTLTFAVLMPVSGWMGDRFGHRRLFCAALVLLALSSVGAALAPGLGALVACRALQGVATAAILPVAMALIRVLFDGPGRARALGAWAAVNGLGQAAGPALGGALTAWFGWRSVFLPVLPTAALGLALGVWLLPRGRPAAIPLDGVGATLLTLAAALGLSSAAAVAPLGVSSPVVWAGAAGGLLAGVAYILAGRRRAAAFLPPRLLLEVRYLRSCLAVLAQMFCLGATLLAVPLALISRAGVTPLVAGAMMLCVPAAMTVLAPVAGLAAERLGARPALRSGLALLLVGQFLTGAVLATRPAADLRLGAAMVVVGAGVAFVQTPAAIGATRSRAGTRGAGLGLFNLLRFGGSALGAAWVAAVLDRGPAFGPAFVVCAAVAGAGLLGSFAGRDPSDHEDVVGGRGQLVGEGAGDGGEGVDVVGEPDHELGVGRPDVHAQRP